jgi:hypothetical protein
LKDSLRIQYDNEASGSDIRIKETFALVQASSFEKHSIWLEWHRLRHENPNHPQYLNWVDTNPGWYYTIGTMRNRPMLLYITWSWVGQDDMKLVCWWEFTSQLRDYQAAEDWLSAKFPHVKHTSNAWNFHNIARTILAPA